MVKEEDLIRLSVSDEAHKIAYRFAYSDKSNYNRHTLRKDNGGRYVGFIGELITIKYLHQNGIKYAWQNRDPSIPNYDFDININGIRLEVKTKDRTVDSRLFYDCSIAAYQVQDCDYYVFTTLTKDKYLEYPYHTAMLCGYLPKSEYMNKSRFLREGHIDPSNGWKVSMDCYNVAIKDLKPISELIHIIRS